MLPPSYFSENALYYALSTIAQTLAAGFGILTAFVYSGYRNLSSNRMCEIGMNLATESDYRSVIFLLEELTRAEL